MSGRLIHHVWQPRSDALGPRRFRRECGYDAFVPDQLVGAQFNLPIDVAAYLSEGEAAIARLQERDDRLLDPLAHLLTRSEAIASSRIEGLQVDARGLARAEARQRVGRRVGTRAREVMDNVDAMQHAIIEAATVERFSSEDLLAVHDVLMRRRLDSAGRIRSSQNWIGGNDYNPCGADFVPPPVDFVPGLMEDLCAFCESEEVPPLFQAAVAHAQFETIHPFDDGNGRTGRALVHVVLRRRGLVAEVVPPISVALSNNRNAYINGLIGFRDGDLTGWLELFVTATLQGVQLAERYRASVLELQNDWRQLLRDGANPRSDAAAWVILDALPGFPVLNRADAAVCSGRSLPAVDLGLRQLEVAGVLVPVRDDPPSRRSWEPVGLLDQIMAIESDLPTAR
ncbi:MAG: Fic family protein [Chloroflexi bacterium]|nr:Fic family protein [Chloroflexota bacterium]